MDEPRSNDPVGDAIRATLNGPRVRVGAVTGAAMFAGAGLAAFALALLPSRTVQSALVVRLGAEHLSVTERIANAFTTPWGQLLSLSVNSTTEDVSQLALWPFLLGLVAIVAGGAYVRRMLATRSERVVALGVAALTVALLVVLVCVLFTYDVSPPGTPRTHVEHLGTSSFIEAFALVVVLGAFTFGIAGMLREPLRTALATAAATFGVVFVAAAVVGGLAIGFGPSSTHDARHFESLANWHVAALNTGTSIGAAAQPLATFAEASLAAADPRTSPLVDYDALNRGSYRAYWPALNTYTETHPHGRITDYADLGTTPVRLLLYLAVVFVLGAWIVATARVISLLGAPRSGDGLRLGLLVGLVGGVLQLIVGWLASQSADVPSGIGFSQTLTDWGTSGGSSLHTLVVLMVVCGLSGLMYAAYRPSPRRHTAWTLSLPRWMAPQRESHPESPEAANQPLPDEPVGPAQPASPAPAHRTNPAPTAIEHPAPSPLAPQPGAVTESLIRTEEPSCNTCGTPYRNREVRFCPNCGAQRDLDHS